MKILCQFVVLIIIILRNIASWTNQKYCRKTTVTLHIQKKKKVDGEIVQVEQTKNTVAIGHSLFLYIDNII